jgi:hypothetical protein
LSKLLSHFFILNYEWAMPEALRTGFQTPIANNVRPQKEKFQSSHLISLQIVAMKELLDKNMADNKGFFYGVTSNLVHFALNNTIKATSGDEFLTVRSKNSYIEMSKVRICIIIPSLYTHFL